MCPTMSSRSVKIRDLDIRHSLHAEVARRHAGEPDTLILDELALCQGQARVDLAVVNGSLNGYEIKSERDTLHRLPGQLDVYGRALDFVTVVVAASHVAAVRNSVPSWWGIWVATGSAGSVKLKETRQPRPNPAVEGVAVAQLLWRDEVTGRVGNTRDLDWRPREIATVLVG